MENNDDVPTISVGFDEVASTTLGVFINTEDEAAVLEKITAPIDWTREGTHPLHAALFAGRDNIALTILKMGSPVTSHSLYLAYRFGNPQTFQKILITHAPTFTPDKNISSTFLDAARGGDTSTVTALIPTLPDINVSDYFYGYEQWTALHHACRLKDAALITALIEAGADPTLHNNKGQTCLDLIHQHTSPKSMSRATLQGIVELLCAHGACSSQLSFLQKVFLRYGVVV